MNMEELLSDLKREYVAALPSRIAELREALKKNDAAALRELFHKLKGTGKTYGLPDVSTVCERGEYLCRDQAELASSAVPILLELMDAIVAQQTKQTPFDLATDPRFKRYLVTFCDSER